MPSNHLIHCCPLHFLPSIFPSIRVFSILSQLFNSGGQSIGTSTSASILPVNTHGLFYLKFTSLISLLSKRFSRVFFSTTTQKHQFSGIQLSLWSNSHINPWLLEKNIALTKQTFVGRMMSLFPNILSRFGIAFLSRSRDLSVLWLQSPSTMILEPPR